MKVNLELSQQYKKEYRHRIKQCYKNAFNLLISGAVDQLALGYVVNTKNKTAIRHAFGIKDGEIVDSTFGNHKKYTEDKKYYIAFTVEADETSKVMQNYQPNLFGYDTGAEQKIIEELRKDGYIVIGF